jgi:AraC-like DNA-binding protein
LALEHVPAGTRIDRHRHPGHQLIYVGTGVLVAQTSAGSWVASCDRAIWMPAGTWHEHRAYGASIIHTLGFNAQDPPPLPDTPAIVAVTALPRELLVALTEPGLPQPEVDRLRAVLRDRLHRTPQRPISLPAPRDPRLARACTIALEHLDKPMPLSALADAAHTTERTLSRLFRAETGMSYPQWRAQARAIYAMILLAQGESVTDAGSLCGWSTTSAFIDSFRRAMGQTPAPTATSPPRKQDEIVAFDNRAWPRVEASPLPRVVYRGAGSSTGYGASKSAEAETSCHAVASSSWRPE